MSKASTRETPRSPSPRQRSSEAPARDGMAVGRSAPRLDSPRAVMQLQRAGGNRAVGRALAAGARRGPDGASGLPTRLQRGVEALSGLSMGDVRVHYGSSRPAEVGALAYAEGTRIHVGPGQERHLPHEAWHVVQQKQGRVRATRQAKDGGLNDDGHLEREATEMGARAMTLGASLGGAAGEAGGGGEGRGPALSTRGVATPVIQRKIGFEFQTVGKGNPKVARIDSVNSSGEYAVTRERSHEATLVAKDVTKPSPGKVEGDMGDLELITGAHEENEEGRRALRADVNDLVRWISDIDSRSTTAAVTETNKTTTGDKRTRRFALATVEGVDGMILNANKFTTRASVQATVGVKLDKLHDLLLMQAKGRGKVKFTPTDDAPTISLGWRGGDKVQGYATTMLTKVASWIAGKEGDDKAGQYGKLKGLLSLLAMTFAQAKYNVDEGITKPLLKDSMPFMHRTHLSHAWAKLSDEEKELLRGLKDDASAAFGDLFEGDKKVDSELSFTRQKVVEQLALGKDLLSEEEAGTDGSRQVGELRESDQDSLDKFHVDKATEIGKSWGDDTKRLDGMIVEMRRVGKRPESPYDKWPQITDAYFRALVYVHSGRVLGKDID